LADFAPDEASRDFIRARLSASGVTAIDAETSGDADDVDPLPMVTLEPDDELELID
jgi:hypothetical protein